MDKRQSGLETWSNISEFDRNSGGVHGALPIILALASALGIAPFMVLRFMHGEILMGLLDACIVSGMLLLGTFVYRTRRVRAASIALSAFCVAALLTTVHFSGAHQVLWAYPCVMAIYYLLRPREATALVLVMIAGVLPALMRETDAFTTTSTIVTLVLIGAFSYSFAAAANRQHKLLLQLATRDPLTGAGNRRALDEKLNDVVASSRRIPGNSSLIMLDLDHFKTVNDRHGHAKGDEILCRITEIVNLRIRVTDSLYRIGGEEFVVVAEHQSLEKAAHLAEQFRTLVEANELVPDRPVTISLGVAELCAGESGSEWLGRADEALYAAKRKGRNTTALAKPNVAKIYSVLSSAESI
ncbi:MAG TPA: GGDEF domain-containing protein [Woeseiaceae bacterium]|nr:GGDEF domain-containing protein [Woeseiaceae bacterium]